MTLNFNLLPFIQAPDVNTKIKTISDSVLKLSDYFIDNPDGATPWHTTYCQMAYYYYYLPLNCLRNLGVIERGLKQNFFSGLEYSVDYGAGPGTASLALALKMQFKQQILLEPAPQASQIITNLSTYLNNPTISKPVPFKNFDINLQKAVLVFSYSLTEMDLLPLNWNEFEAIMILDPSTQLDGRKLLATRDLLLKEGYSIWAPCVHQGQCPLQIHSKNDWCHDRFHIDTPDWFKKIEDYLPMKNKTITTSYLLARKQKPKKIHSNTARLTGDSMNEKGKTRQLICRSEEREFLTWMHKEIPPQELHRGDLVTLPETDFIKKSNELRATTKINLAD